MDETQDFNPPKVTVFDHNDPESYYQLNAFYNYVINHLNLIQEWREDALRVEAILRGQPPCPICPHRTKPEDVFQGCNRAGCSFAHIWLWRKTTEKLKTLIAKYEYYTKPELVDRIDDLVRDLLAVAEPKKKKEIGRNENS